MRFISPRPVVLVPAALALATAVFAQSGGPTVTPQLLRQVEEFEARANVSNSPDTIMDAVGVKPGMVVGEIGARHGRIAIPLARRVGASGRVYANDIDGDALAVLRARCASAKITNIETVLGKVDDPLFPPASLDMALMVWTYHEVSQPAALLRNLARALKPGATVALVEPYIVTRQAVEANAGPAGLELVNVIETLIARDNVYILRKK